jgi:hypothetical protein
MRPLALLFITIILFVSLSASEQPRGSSLAQILSTQQITRASKMIFSGVVLQVKRSQNATGSTQITFRVENAIRGVRRGLWNSGERYARGEHVLLFLYPKSKLGLTSPVGGNSGRYAVDAAGRVLVPSSQNGPHSFPLKTVKADIQRAAQE